MRSKKLVWSLIVLTLVVSAVSVPAVFAAATAQGVTLAAGSTCTDGALAITLTTSGATREYGLATNSGGTMLSEFEHSTVISNFSGTFNGYGIPFPDQPDGTIIGLYAYVGETPPSAGDTAEFFVLYRCDTGGANQVLDTCYGPYGTCPRTAQAYTPETTEGPVPGCDALVNIPSQAVMGRFVADAAVYSAPGQLVTPALTITAGKTYLVTGQDASGQYRQILLQCSFVWVPANTVGPNPDNVWNSRPLPTTVVN